MGICAHFGLIYSEIAETIYNLLKRNQNKPKKNFKMRFTVYLGAAMIALTSNMTAEAINLEDITTNVTGFDPKKYNWIESPPNSGHYIKKNKPEMKPQPLSRV